MTTPPSSSGSVLGTRRLTFRSVKPLDRSIQLSVVFSEFQKSFCLALRQLSAMFRSIFRGLAKHPLGCCCYKFDELERVTQYSACVRGCVSLFAAYACKTVLTLRECKWGKASKTTQKPPCLGDNQSR